MVILVTRCVSECKLQSLSLFEFHFKGYLKGEKVDRVLLEGKLNQFEVKQDYLIALSVLELEKGTLRGSLLKYKKL